MCHCEARYNIASSQEILASGDFGSGIEARFLTWGLIPAWSTDGKGFINARAEALEGEPSFSESFRLRRCLIPADGFFEFRWTLPVNYKFVSEANEFIAF